MGSFTTFSPASSWENRCLPTGAKAQPAKGREEVPLGGRLELRGGKSTRPRVTGERKWVLLVFCGVCSFWDGTDGDLKTTVYLQLLWKARDREKKKKSLEGVALVKPTVPFSHHEGGCYSCFLSLLWGATSHPRTHPWAVSETFASV